MTVTGMQHSHLTQTLSAKVVGFEPDPVSIEEALARPDGEQWHQAIDSELNSLKERGSWDVVPLPPRGQDNWQ